MRPDRGATMKQHTNAYFEWTTSDEAFIHHMEWITENREIDVRVRKNSFGDIQIFNGVYDKNGLVRMEEYIPDLDIHTVEDALAWGIKRTTSYSAEKS